MKKKLSALIDELAKNYPLPQRWRLGEKLLETRVIAKTTVNLIGLTAKSSDLAPLQAIASAGSIHDNLKTLALRAYFELIERVAILEALEKPVEMQEVLTIDGYVVNHHSIRELFPESPEPEVWTFAKSSGVAAYTDRDFACWQAYKELMERAIILRSWYGAEAPRQIEHHLALSAIDQRRLSHSGIKLYEFSTPEDGLYCVGAFAPTPQGYHLFGFSAARDRDHAVYSAVEEMFQRMGFLVDEPALALPPVFAANPAYHQEFYLSHQGCALLTQWLAGKFAQDNALAQASLPGIKRCFFIDLTPESLRGKCHVIKAFHPEIPPLIFGHAPLPGARDSYDLFPHPIA